MHISLLCSGSTIAIYVIQRLATVASSSSIHHIPKLLLASIPPSANPLPRIDV